MASHTDLEESGDQTPPNFQMKLVKLQELVKKTPPQLVKSLRSEINEEDLKILKK